MARYTGARVNAIPDKTQGRVDYLRLSITDRCNLRCTYCMPAEGLSWLSKPELLTDDEVLRLVRVAVGLGIREVRFTGGEPHLSDAQTDGDPHQPQHLVVGEKLRLGQPGQPLLRHACLLYTSDAADE